MNNLNKLPLRVGFTAGGWIKSITPHSLQIHSANFLQCMKINNELFEISNIQVSPK
jgi:hypothetical protein